jgi:hypothetical protein
VRLPPLDLKLWPSEYPAQRQYQLSKNSTASPKIYRPQRSRIASPRHNSAIQHRPGTAAPTMPSSSLPSPAACGTSIPLASWPSLTPLISTLSLALPLSPRKSGAELCGPRGMSSVKRTTSPFLSCLPFSSACSCLLALGQSGLFKFPLCQQLQDGHYETSDQYSVSTAAR